MTDLPPEYRINEQDILAREFVAHDKPTTDKTRARRAAIQILYELDSSSHSLEQIIDSFFESQENDRSTRKIRTYLQKLVYGTVSNQSKIDQIIHQYAPEYPVDQLATIDRNILRIGIYEFGIATETPLSVAVDEAVNLGKLFGADGSIRFINGVLGSIADNIDVVRQQLDETGAIPYQLEDEIDDGEATT